MLKTSNPAPFQALFKIFPSADVFFNKTCLELSHTTSISHTKIQIPANWFDEYCNIDTAISISKLYKFSGPARELEWRVEGDYLKIVSTQYKTVNTVDLHIKTEEPLAQSLNCEPAFSLKLPPSEFQKILAPFSGGPAQFSTENLDLVIKTETECVVLKLESKPQVDVCAKFKTAPISTFLRDVGAQFVTLYIGTDNLLCMLFFCCIKRKYSILPIGLFFKVSNVCLIQ